MKLLYLAKRLTPRPIKQAIKRILGWDRLPVTAWPKSSMSDAERKQTPPVKGTTARPPTRIREFEVVLPGSGWGTGDPTQAERLRIRAPQHLLIPRKLAEHGLAGYEPGTIACLLAALECLPPGGFFDVGSNVGLFALLARRFSERDVVAFEPTPELVAVARDLAALNQLPYRIVEAALGPMVGTATLYLSDSTDSSNSLRPGFRTSSRTLEVAVTTLDQVVEDLGTEPALIKIDTEATEPDVLRGGLGVLERVRPWLICEVLAGRTEDELMALLAPFGYRYHLITEEGPFPRRDTIEGDRTYEHLNWLFTPEPPGQAFWDSHARWSRALAMTDRDTDRRPGPDR